MARQWFVPFKQGLDAPSHEHNWTSLEEFLNALELPEGEGGLGSEHHISTGAPSAGDGVDGDVWFDLTNEKIYVKEAGGWTLAFSATEEHFVQTTTPLAPAVGDVWVDPSAPTEFLVEADADLLYLQLAGGTLTGFLTLHADPTALLHAATKQYVDTQDHDQVHDTDGADHSSGAATSGHILTADGVGGQSWLAPSAGLPTFADNVFRIYDEVDNTKKLALSVGGITTANTRTLTVPDKDGTIALLDDEKHTVGPTAPVSPSLGDVWVDTTAT